MKKTFLIASLVFASCSHEVTPGQLAAGPKPLDPNAVITGTVKLKDGLAMRGTGTLFVITRPKGMTGGPPLAVKRVEDPVLPIRFEMSQANVMIQGNRFEGDVTVTAKWTKQDSPLSSSPGDLSTSAPLDVKVGARDLELILDRETP